MANKEECQHEWVFDIEEPFEGAWIAYFSCIYCGAEDIVSQSD